MHSGSERNELMSLQLNCNKFSVSRGEKSSHWSRGWMSLTSSDARLISIDNCESILKYLRKIR